MKMNGSYQLPTEKTKPKEELRDYPILIYGRERVGKTTLCAEFEDPFFIFSEPGGKSLSLHSDRANSWEDVQNMVKALRKSHFKTVVIDTVDKVYDFCMDWVCKEMDITHPQDAGYGKAWKAVIAEFERVLLPLCSSKGVIFTSHSREKDIEDVDGNVKTMVGPSCSGQPMEFLRRYVDLFAYYYYGKNGRRYLRVKGTDEVVAGNRIEGHFAGVSLIPAGNSAAECYSSFVAAFDNKLQNEKPKLKLRR